MSALCNMADSATSAAQMSLLRLVMGFRMPPQQVTPTAASPSSAAGPAERCSSPLRYEGNCLKCWSGCSCRGGQGMPGSAAGLESDLGLVGPRLGKSSSRMTNPAIGGGDAFSGRSGGAERGGGGTAAMRCAGTADQRSSGACPGHSISGTCGQPDSQY